MHQTQIKNFQLFDFDFSLAWFELPGQDKKRPKEKTMFKKIQQTIIEYLLKNHYLRNILFTKAHLDAYDSMVDMENIWPLPRQQLIDDETWNSGKEVLGQ